MDPTAWLSEARRSIVAIAVATVAMLAFALPRSDADAVRAQAIDNGVVLMAAYLVVYVGLTAVAFGRASTDDVAGWARRSDRGTWLQRYVLGTAPGPGLAIFVALVALVVAVWWLPGAAAEGSTLSSAVRAGLGVVIVVAAWTAVVASFAVAYHAEDLLGDGRGLSFPGTAPPGWTDYVYFALAVTTTFGTTDVEVTTSAVRRTVTVHAVLAFVFNTVVLAAVVSALLA